MFPISLRCLTLTLTLTLGIPATCLSAEAIDEVSVERLSLDETVQLDGLIEAVQQSTVSAQTSGRVIALPFDVDDSVPAGALIVQLEDNEQQARLSQAQAGLSEAQAGLLDARQQFERTRLLHERHLIANQTLDQARNQLSASEARLSRTQAAVAEAHKQLEYTRVTAPYGGILTERHVELGESVNPGQPLLSGLSLEQLRVVVDLPQQYAGIAREQRRARVTLPDGNELETGHMTFYPYADPVSHSFRLRMALNETGGRLFPGMLVKVSVPVASRAALWIPTQSLLHRSELRTVFVLEADKTPRLRQVRTGVHSGDRIEILAGLNEGERIVANPMTIHDHTVPTSTQEPRP